MYIESIASWGLVHVPSLWSLHVQETSYWSREAVVYVSDFVPVFPLSFNPS